MNEQSKRKLDAQQKQRGIIAALENPDNAVLGNHMHAALTIFRNWRGCDTPAERFVFALPAHWRHANLPLTPESARRQLGEFEAKLDDAVMAAEPEFAARYPGAVAATAREVAV
jgi:hypothetical protein